MVKFHLFGNEIHNHIDFRLETNSAALQGYTSKVLHVFYNVRSLFWCKFVSAHSLVQVCSSPSTPSTSRALTITYWWRRTAASLSPSGGWPAPRCLHLWAPACSGTTRPRSAFSPTSPSLTRGSTSLSPVWTPSVIHHIGGRGKSETGAVQILLTAEKRTDSERLQHEALEVYVGSESETY